MGHMISKLVSYIPVGRVQIILFRVKMQKFLHFLCKFYAFFMVFESIFSSILLF